LYTVIVIWIKYDQDREVKLTSLSLTLDLQNVPFKFETGIIAKEPLVKSNMDCLNAVMTYFADISRNVSEESNASKIICVGGARTRSVREI